jgi:hypothetical protein
MKKSPTCSILSFLIAAEAVLAAQPASNAVHWIAPSNSLTAAAWPYPWKSPFAIATNTPAFEACGLNLMLTSANEMREKWQLDIPKPLALDDVFFAVFPGAQGIEGHLMTRDRRFHWSFSYNVLCAFTDHQYYPGSFRYHDDESARLGKIKSKITKKEAEAIARHALRQMFGLTEKQLHLKTSVEVNQYKFEESNGVVYPLPMFNVVWRVKGPTQYSAKNLEYRPVYMDISGITKRVAGYAHTERLSPDCPIPRPPMPTNYFQMLGLPDNYLDSVGERTRSSWGLPPLTNSPSQITNSSK